MKRIVTVLMSSLLFSCSFSFSASFKNSSPSEGSENCLRSGTGGPSLCLHPLLSRNIIFFPAKTKSLAKRFAHAISVCTIRILSTLAYTEFDRAALLAMFF